MRKIFLTLAVILAGLYPFAEVQAAPAVEVDLKGLAVQENGAIKVIGTEPDSSYQNDENRKRKVVYDGNVSTFYDPTDAEGAWSGFEITKPMVPTRVRYKGRSGNNRWRMRGCLFQGANQADFSDAVTLHQANPPANWEPLNWFTINLTPTEQSFRFFRITSHPTGNGEEGKYCGNASEVEFFGIEPPMETTPPDTPVLEATDGVNRVPVIAFKRCPRALFYRIEKRPASQAEGDFTFVVEIADFRLSGERVSFADPQKLQRETVYRVAAFITESNGSAWAQQNFKPDPRILSGRVIGTPGSYNNLGNTREHAFDGDLGSACDVGLTGGGAWVGLDLGGEAVVTEIRFWGIENNSWRMKNGLFEIANHEDFSDARLLYRYPDQDPGTAMKTITLEPPYQKGRYVRFKSVYEYCNVMEIEFLGDGSPSASPRNLRAELQDRAEGTATLKWDLPDSAAYDRVQVKRATAPGGPWEEMVPEGLPPETTAWTDSTARRFVKYYYRVNLINLDPESPTGMRGGPDSDSTFWRRAVWLERDAAAPTRLKTGASLVFQGTLHYPGGGSVAEGPWENGFDNDPETFISGNEEGGRIGIRFDKPYRIALVRVMPRNSGTLGVGRLNGAEIWGSLDGIAGGRKLNGGGPISGAAKQGFSHLQIDEEESFNTVFLKKDSGFFCNLSEMEIYGWESSQEPTDLLLAPTGLLFSGENGKMKLSWTAGANATHYRIERKAQGEDTWTTASEFVDGVSFVDTAAPMGTPYTYRIASVRIVGQDRELAYCADTPAWIYQTGNGTGLHTTIRDAYRATYNPEEKIVEERVDPTVDFNRTREPLLRENNDPFSVIWNGKLIVPHDGTYTFLLKHDDGGALWIDDRPIINNRWDGDLSAWQKGSMELTRGEHPIRIDYYAGGGIDACQLKWSGAVPEEIIPATQLIPIKPVLPGEWLGERTFNLPKKGHTSFNKDGSILMQGGGRDIWAEDEGFHYLWTRIKGNFEAEMRYTLPAETATQGIKIMIMVRKALTIGQTPFIAPAAQKTGDQFSYSGIARRTSEDAIENLSTAEGGWTYAGGVSGWLKIRREGETFTSFWREGESGEWAQIGVPVTLAPEILPKELFVGPAITTNNSQPVEAVTVSDFRLLKLGAGTLLLLK